METIYALLSLCEMNAGGFHSNMSSNAIVLLSYVCPNKVLIKRWDPMTMMLRPHSNKEITKVLHCWIYAQGDQTVTCAFPTQSESNPDIHIRARDSIYLPGLGFLNTFHPSVNVLLAAQFHNFAEKDLLDDILRRD